MNVLVVVNQVFSPPKRTRATSATFYVTVTRWKGRATILMLLMHLSQMTVSVIFAAKFRVTAQIANKLACFLCNMASRTRSARDALTADQVLYTLACPATRGTLHINSPSCRYFASRIYAEFLYCSPNACFRWVDRTKCQESSEYFEVQWLAWVATQAKEV